MSQEVESKSLRKKSRPWEVVHASKRPKGSKFDRSKIFHVNEARPLRLQIFSHHSINKHFNLT